MQNKVKKLIWFRFNQYRDIEQKLERMAKNGFFLEKVGSLFWTFKRGKPQDLKYTVTYFSEASIFNPSATDNQQTYFDYARESGWYFVTEFHQMQIFCSEAEDPIPFETDEREKFENIKKCMGKNFFPSTVAMVFIFMLNLFLQYNSYKLDPIDFLSETSRLFPVAIMIPTVIYLICTVIAYFIWCKQCEKSLSIGGRCIEKTHKYQKIVDITLISYDFILLALFLLDLFQNSNLVLITLSIIHLPILIFIFQFSIQYLKKKKQSAIRNRVISYTLLTITSFAYIFCIMMIIIKFDIPNGKGKPYRTVTWQMTPTETREYKVYSDNIPLKCEDLYKNIEYDNYSYEKDMDDSIFLTRSQYRQDSLPGRNSPPSIEYVVIEPKFKFAYDIVVEDLKKTSEWSDKKIEAIDNLLFNTQEAYQFYYNDMGYTGDYLLLYKDKIVLLNLEEPAAKQQVSIIIEKLKLYGM